MRTKSLMMVGAVLLMAAGARAQDTPQTPPAVSAAGSEFAPVNQIDFGVRGTAFANGSDKARFQRYQDFRDGGTLDKIRIFKETEQYGVKLQADHVGYRDQRFFGSYNNFGNLKASFEWNQTPLFYSETTRSLYTQTSPGVFVLPAGVQTGIQAGTLKLQNALTNASPFTIDAKRSVADFNVLYSASQTVNIAFNVKNTQREGSQPASASWGFSTASDELALPIDTRTTEFGTSVEYANERGFVKAGYDASLFRNNIPTLTWANPMRATDSTTLGSQGRMALWPNTDQNTVSASAGLNKLPGRSHVSAYVSYGALSNNDPLIPWTINSAISAPALPRTTADVRARVTAMNFNFTSRPLTTVWFNVRYRQYQFDNRTSPFLANASVSLDSTLSTTPLETEAFGFTRHTFDAETSYSPISFVGLRAGYTREAIDRNFRFVENTVEDIGRVSVDLTGATWLNLRGVYEHSKRTGTPVDPAEILAVGEHPETGNFDVSNRNRDRVTAIVTVTPFSAVSFNASAGRIKDDYPTSYFGLRNSDNNVYGVGFDAVPIENKLSFGANFGYEKNNALQASRYAPHVTSGPNPNFDDPGSDWTDLNADRAKTANASIDILQIVPKFDLKLGYDYTRAETTFNYTIGSGTPIKNLTSATGAIGQALPTALPAVTNQMQRGIVDGLYHVTNHLGLGVAYMYDKYTVNDFALGPQANGLVPSAASATPSIMMLGYNYLPYTANTFWGRLTYRW